MVKNNAAPNAEWANWVQEAADHAAGNGSRSCDTYRRAAKAIRLHPEKLVHPVEALAIKGVGEGIVRLITSRLQQHCEENDIPFPDEPLSQKNGAKRKKKQANSGPSSSQHPRKRRDLELTAEERALDESSSTDDEHPSRSNDFSVTQKIRVTQKKKRVRRRKDDLTPSELALDQSDSSDSSQPAPSAPKTKAKTKKTTKKKTPRIKNYIPNRRTGCWGMLVALYILTVSQAGPFSKAEIIQHAQNYCDASYVEPGSRGGGAGNSGHYTAWNMKKLLLEGLTASAPGRTPKFMLTKAGFEVAWILAEKEKCDIKDFDASNLPNGIFNIDLNVPEVDEGRELEVESGPSNSQPKPKTSNSTKTTRRKKDGLNHAQTEREVQPNDENEPQEIVHEIVSNYRITLGNSSLAVEEAIRPAPNPIQALLPNRGPFEFWYLDRNGSRVKKLDEADSRMHPITFETLYQVEFRKVQSVHPVKRSSIVDDSPLKPTLKYNTEERFTMIGWMYESKAIPNCPGFTLTSTNSSSSSVGACDVGHTKLQDNSINPPPNLTSTIHQNLLKPPSTSLLDNNLSRTSSNADRTIHIIDDDDPPVVPNRMVRRTCSGTGSLTPVGSFNSVLSEDDTSCGYSQQIVDLLRPTDQRGMRTKSMVSNTSTIGGGGMGSETPIGSWSSESTDSNENVQFQLESQCHSNNTNQTSGNLAHIDLTQTTDKAIHIDLTQPTSTAMTEIEPDPLDSLPIVRSKEADVNLKRIPSNMSENRSNRSRMTTEDNDPQPIDPQPVESLPLERTQVSLKRTNSNLSQNSSYPTQTRSETSGEKTIESLPIQRTQVKFRRTCSNLSEANFNQTSITTTNEPEVWEAGTYDLCLILDHREVGSLKDREAMFNMCQTKAKKISEEDGDGGIQVQVVQRALVLGDALWIAVNRFDKREVVLDSIVERKRLDDLCSSIKDNRFSEQKARLRRSGLRDPIYLVEAYNTHANLETHGPMIYTAKSEVMLLNDFQLELTSDWKASVEFLMRRTEVLKDLHKNIDLTLIPEADIDPISYSKMLQELRDRDPRRYWVTTYKDYEILNNKSNNLTVTELWARMVSCLSGMSAEKVNNFVQTWDTPISFWNQVQLHQRQAEAEEHLDSLEELTTSQKSASPWDWIEKQSKYNSLPDGPSPSIGGSSNASKSTASIGPALSKRLWELYALSEY